MLLQFSQFSPLSHLHPATQPSSIPPTYFMSMGYTYKFFESSVSYTIFWPLSNYLMPTNYASSSLYLSPLFLPPHFPLKALHVMFIFQILFLF